MCGVVVNGTDMQVRRSPLAIPDMLRRRCSNRRSIVHRDIIISTDDSQSVYRGTGGGGVGVGGAHWYGGIVFAAVVAAAAAGEQVAYPGA